MAGVFKGRGDVLEGQRAALAREEQLGATILGLQEKILAVSGGWRVVAACQERGAGPSQPHVTRVALSLPPCPYTRVPR
jgi:hypothetical protein